MNKQITDIIIHEDGRRERIYRRIGPNGETHSEELHKFMGPCVCTICNRPMSEHTLKDFGDHLDEHHRRQGFKV